MPERRPFIAGIVDFNPKRMTGREAEEREIPRYLTQYVADWRQYPLHIAAHFTEGVSYFRADQPWYFASLMSNAESVTKLRESDVMFLSGSGLSAHKFQRGENQGEYQEPLAKTQEVIRDFLGDGKWVFGICYGGQLAVGAIGGEIGRLPKGVTEAGWLSHKLTPAGERDEVFGLLHTKFSAPHFHNDFVAKLPEVGASVYTSSGKMRVVRSEVLATRSAYHGRDGEHFHNGGYIMASLVELNNGARLYQIQPHPEMATPQKANFLVRMNPWMAGEQEMGRRYYENALTIFDGADFSVSQLIPTFIRVAKKRIELQRGINFVDAMAVQNLYRFLLP